MFVSTHPGVEDDKSLKYLVKLLPVTTTLYTLPEVCRNLQASSER